MATHAVITATVYIATPDDVTFDDLNDAWSEWLALLRLRSWDHTGTTAEFVLSHE